MMSPGPAHAATSLAWVENRNAIGCHPDCGFDLWRMAPDGSGAAVTASSPTRNALWADWTSDGSRLVYVYKFTDASGNEASELRVMNPDLSGDRELAAERPGFRMTPEWSPDGTRVVFALYEGGRVLSTSDLFTVAADGTGLRRLTSLPGEELEPTYSSDGTRIVFARQDATRPPAVTSIWSVRADDGGDLRRHVDGDALVSLSNIAFSPLGTRMAFTGGSDGRLFLASLDGSGIEPVAPPVSLEPAWSPDASTLAYVRLEPAGGQTLWTTPVDDADAATPVRESFQRGYGIDGADWVSDAPPASAPLADRRPPAVTLARLTRRDGRVVRTTFGPTSNAKRRAGFRVTRRRDLAFVASDRSGLQTVAVVVARRGRVVVRSASDWSRVRGKLRRGVNSLEFRTADTAGNAATSRRVTVRVGRR